MFRTLPAAALALLFCQAGPAQQKTDGWIELFNGKDTAGWKFAPRKSTSPSISTPTARKSPAPSK